MLGGIVLQNPWLILAGFFIMIGAQVEDQGVFFQSVVDTVRMREVMLTDFARSRLRHAGPMRSIVACTRCRKIFP